MIEYRYRKKGEKLIVEKRIEGNKWQGRTLPAPEVMFNQLCPAFVSSKDVKTSQESPETAQNNKQEFVQSSLTEPLKQDTLTPEEIFKRAKAKQEELLKKIWVPKKEGMPDE